MLLYSQEDKQKARKRVGDNYPPKEFVENVYHKTADFLQVGAGSGLGHTFALHMDELCRVMHLPVLQTYSALHLLSLAGYVDFQEEQDTQARVKVNVPLSRWQEYALDGEQIDYLQMLLRHYPGVMTDLQYLREDITPDTHRLLAALAARHIVTYIPHTRANMLTFTRERQTDVALPLRVYEERQTHYVERLKAMVEYAEQTQFCRSQLLVSYFGETDASCCGTCDVCRHHQS